MVRLYKPEDYETVAGWWKEWGWPPILEGHLPKIGVIVDGKAAAWLYQTDSDVAFLEWFVTSKEREGREEAKSAVIQALTGIAKELGYKSVFSFVRNQHLIKTFQRNDYELCDEQMSILVRNI